MATLSTQQTYTHTRTKCGDATTQIYATLLPSSIAHTHTHLQYTGCWLLLLPCVTDEVSATTWLLAATVRQRHSHTHRLVVGSSHRNMYIWICICVYDDVRSWDRMTTKRRDRLLPKSHIRNVLCDATRFVGLASHNRISFHTNNNPHTHRFELNI